MAKKSIPAKVKLVRESKLKQKKSNIHISFSQLSTYQNCNHKWYLQYVKKLLPYDPSIHAAFGTGMHETIQKWLDVLYNDKVKTANEMDLDALLYEEMVKAYKSQKAQNGHQTFSSAEEMQMFFQDGKHILNYLKKKRGGYFSTKGTHLAGIETLLYHEIKPGVMFKGFIDLVFYNEISDTWLLVDLKTSTSGWSKWAKEDEVKTSQLVLYKEYFAKQFDIDVEKIDIEYFILKRRVPKDAEFAAMQKRVQSFKPASGKVKRNKAVQGIENFIDDAIGANNEFKDYKPYITNPSKGNCMFCPAGRMQLCKDAVA
jgi:Zn/Cd-binding protein ZinT